MKTVVLRFSCIYPSLNKLLRMHHWKRNRLKNEFTRAICAEIKAQNPPRFDGAVRIEMDLLFRSSPARRDKDNYPPKWLLDALVKSEVIRDDDSKVIPESIDVSFIDGEPRDGIDIRITELEE